MNINEWINQCFSRLKTSPDDLAAYQEFMLHEIRNYPDSQGLNFHECRDSLTEPEDPESSTHAEFLESQGQEFIGYYAASLKDGHMENYAVAYATERISGEHEDSGSTSAYQAIGAKDQPWSTENPGYQDAMQACRHKGKSGDFAHHCAESLPEHGFIFKDAFEAAVEHEQHIVKALSKGRSLIFANAYAKAWNLFAEVEEVALNYAECFEKLLSAGRPSDEASWIAKQYATKHLEGYVDDERDLTFEFAKCEALAQAESAYRFIVLPAEDKKLPDLFLKICQRKYPAKHSKQWFDEIETLARSALAGNMKLEDIQRSSYMEYLEEEKLREESENPSRFGLMSDTELMSFRPKSEDEQDKCDAEVQFRDGCRDMDLDPTNPDERARFQEILDETHDYR